MSTSAVSSSSLNQQLQSYFLTRNTDVQQLGQALQSGNLKDAQVEFNNITALGQSGPFASGNAFRGQARQEDFNAIGQALQSGDLAGAQAAFAALKSTVSQTGGQGGTAVPIPTADAASSTSGGVGPEIVVNLSNSSANPEQITIDIGQTSSGAEQVSLSIGNQASQGTTPGAGQASSPEQTTFNLNPNSSEQIILNLLNLGSATSTSTAANGTSISTTAGSGLSVSA